MTRFISLWTHPDYPPDSVAGAELENLEDRLQTHLPMDYKESALQFGLPSPTIELLNAICDRDLDLRDVSEFLGPNEIVEHTESWRDLGLSEELVAFATDCMGNLFCFPISSTESRELPVFFWDHDSKNLDSVASSFSKWIDDFCQLAPN